MSIHVAPVVLQVRGFNRRIDVDKPLYQMSEPYDFTMLVTINDAGVARLMGLDGQISHSDRRRLAMHLKKLGVVRVEWRHNGIDKQLILQRLQ